MLIAKLLNPNFFVYVSCQKEIAEWISIRKFI